MFAAIVYPWRKSHNCIDTRAISMKEIRRCTVAKFLFLSPGSVSGLYQTIETQCESRYLTLLQRQ